MDTSVGITTPTDATKQVIQNVFQDFSYTNQIRSTWHVFVYTSVGGQSTLSGPMMDAVKNPPGASIKLAEKGVTSVGVPNSPTFFGLAYARGAFAWFVCRVSPPCEYHIAGWWWWSVSWAKNIGTGFINKYSWFIYLDRTYFWDARVTISTGCFDIYMILFFSCFMVRRGKEFFNVWLLYSCGSIMCHVQQEKQVVMKLYDMVL